MKTDLIYGVEDRPPFKDALFAALQHLLAIFVAIITPPLIIASALKLDVEKTSFLVSMSLFASGVSTFIQCRRIGPIGAKLLCIQGTSFSFIGPIIATGLVGGQVSSQYHHPASVRHCRTTDRIESDQSRYRFLWRRIWRDGRRLLRFVGKSVHCCTRIVERLVFQSLQKQIPAHEFHRVRPLSGLWTGFRPGKSKYERTKCRDADEFQHPATF